MEVAPVGGASAKTGMRMDGWMDGWMLLVGRNNAHHLKAQNSKTLKKEGRNVSTQMLLFGVSSITNQPTNQPTNFSFFVSISGLSIYSYLMYTICLAFSFLAILFHIKFIFNCVGEKQFICFLYQCREVGPMSESGILSSIISGIWGTGTTSLMLCIFMHSFSLQNSYSVVLEK